MHIGEMKIESNLQEFMGFLSKTKELTSYLEFLEEAKKRDHRK